MPGFRPSLVGICPAASFETGSWLFEQLEAGKLKLDSQLQVSKEAAGQMPTKLGLKPGSTLAVEDAIKGMVTRSANDAAVVVAEAIAGDEDAFARLMTRKAQALGMSRTVYKNASGLPDSNQVTTARDQSTLGRAVQERFPRYYKYFSIRTFTFRGQSIGNHNHLLGRVEGVDGIKTGYVNASGFNLVTSVHRGNRYLVAVVMGGSSAGSRDAKMRDLISDKIAQASVKRTAPMVAEGFVPSEAKPEPKAVAKIEAKPGRRWRPRSTPNRSRRPRPRASTEVQERGAVRRRQRHQPARALQFRARAGGTGDDQVGVAAGGRATAEHRRLDRSDSAGAREDALGQGGNADRVARADECPLAAGGRASTCAGRRAGDTARTAGTGRRGQAGAAGAATGARRCSQARARAFRSAGGREDRGPAAGAGDCKQAGGAGLILCRGCREGGARRAPAHAQSARRSVGGRTGTGCRRGRAHPCPGARARGQAAASQRLDDPGRRLSGRTGGQEASLRRAGQGGQDADPRRSVHRNRREGWHHALPRALCRSRQGLSRSCLQVSQA